MCDSCDFVSLFFRCSDRTFAYGSSRSDKDCCEEREKGEQGEGGGERDRLTTSIFSMQEARPFDDTRYGENKRKLNSREREKKLKSLVQGDLNACGMYHR